VCEPAQNEIPSAFIALGSNLGDSRLNIERAFQSLESLSRGPVLRSSLWKSTPVDCPPGSPEFINAVAALTPYPDATSESLLQQLQYLESRFGRIPKTILNEPRPLDLDLIAFGTEARHSPILILPHPRAHLRKFVLAPLAEIAPNFILPGQKKSVRELLEALRTDEVVEKLA
jgi:2-amino-4-hydroxy-6-hydroxymethyldihydropteridine diphosphokinase